MAREGFQEGRLTPQMSAFRRDNLRWLSDERIVGYGFPGQGGFDKKSQIPARIAIYTDDDEKVAALQERVVPPGLVLPGQAVRLPIEIINIGHVRPYWNLSGRNRPANPGMSISHFRNAAGTLGLIVKKIGERPDLFILSSNHVLAEYNRLDRGADIIQPGLNDGGRPVDKIAELTEIVELQFHDREYKNKVDAAIARVIDVEDVQDAIALLGRVSGVGRTIRRGTHVRICGRTSGQSSGDVVDPSARVRLPYPRGPNSSSLCGFFDVVICTPFTRKGDSGAAVLSPSNEILGLIMAGSSRASLFCKMQHICDDLQIEPAVVHHDI